MLSGGALRMRAYHHTTPLCSGNVLPIWREYWRRPAETELLTAHHRRKFSAACRMARWSTNATPPEVHPGARFARGGNRAGHTAHARASLSLLSGCALNSLSLCVVPVALAKLKSAATSNQEVLAGRALCAPPRIGCKPDQGQVLASSTWTGLHSIVRPVTARHRAWL